MQAGALALGRLSERPWTGETVPADLIKSSVLRHTVGFGAEGEGQVERVNGGSVLGQSQMTQLRVVAQEVDYLGSARAELFRGLSVGQDDRLSLLRHFQNPAVIVWPHRIGDFHQAVLVG